MSQGKAAVLAIPKLKGKEKAKLSFWNFWPKCHRGFLRFYGEDTLLRRKGTKEQKKDLQPLDRTVYIV
jgi:hypothetical protein